MATRAQMKRTIKLRQADAQGREFIRVNSNSKTNWASCNFSKPGFETPLSVWHKGGGISFTDFLFVAPGLIVASGIMAIPSAGATAVSIGIPTVGMTAAYTGFAVQQAFASLVIAEAGRLAALGLGTILQAVPFGATTKTPEYTNFKKPCDKTGQGKF